MKTDVLGFAACVYVGHCMQDYVSLPEHFVQNGYNVGGSGKLFHPNVPADFDQAWSWTVPYIEYGDNKTQLCEDECCGISDYNSTGGPGQEGNGRVCVEFRELTVGNRSGGQVTPMMAAT